MKQVEALKALKKKKGNKEGIKPAERSFPKKTWELMKIRIK